MPVLINAFASMRTNGDRAGGFDIQEVADRISGFLEMRSQKAAGEAQDAAEARGVAPFSPRSFRAGPAKR